MYQRGRDDPPSHKTVSQVRTITSKDLGLAARHPIGGNLSSTPQTIPLTRRIHGGLAVAVGVLVAIAVAVTLIAVTGTNNPAQRTVKPKPKSVTPTLSSRLASLSPQERQYVLAIAALSPRQLAAGYGTSPAAAVGRAASSPQTRYLGPRQPRAVVNGGPLPAAAGSNASSRTVQPNPDQQAVTSHSLPRGVGLPGWLLR